MALVHTAIIILTGVGSSPDYQGKKSITLTLLAPAASIPRTPMIFLASHAWGPTPHSWRACMCLE